jgi:hypothetical protein
MTHPNVSTANVSIAQVETAINVWRMRNPALSNEDVLVLCAEARCLANLYGKMIYLCEATVARETFNEAQLAALAGALK